MAKNNKKDHFMAVPIEKHDTASWANIDDMKPVSNVHIPSEFEVMNAKEYADQNEK
ncbi:MAG: hypothetical protein K0S51_2004 [Bacillales bacterium]|jgi:hypothetical protein|nr:hypothetical protein [Bacillales bacterium]